ncbi:MAG: phosphate ABC transporter permease PstA [Rubrobacter sp.]|jgi:phosphate transport system permease protein|nr:phosphate ABC transporter permease PstA [Rubrobacter sp.]
MAAGQLESGATASDRRRKLMDKFMTGVAYFFTFIAIAVLVWVIAYVIVRGISVWSPAFFSENTALFGDGGGIYNAMYGTFVIVLMAIAIGVPMGIMAGIYLAEFGDNRLGDFIRFIADTMAGIPSIAVGLFMYGLLILIMGWNAFAGACALAILMLPVVARTTEGIIRLVPGEIREASLALGLPQWKTMLRVVLPTAAGGIITGAFLAVARAAGETAPLIFTILGSNFFNSNPMEGAMAAVSLYVYQASSSPYQAVQEAGWGAALVLLLFVLGLNFIARAIAFTQKQN